MSQYLNNQHILNLLRQKGALRDSQIKEVQSLLARQADTDLARVLIKGGFLSADKLIDLGLNLSNNPATETPAIDPEKTAVHELAEEIGKEKIDLIISLIIKQAILNRATDIHFEPQENFLRVRFRVNGILHDVVNLPANFSHLIIARLKKMGSLNKELFSGNRIKFIDNNKTFYLRALFIPLLNNEQAVLHFLDYQKPALSLAQLGFSSLNVRNISAALSQKSGITLVAGPAGSGKSTTIFALLNMLNNNHCHIATIENPIEYRLPGASQVCNQPASGFTYASALAAILRLEPDVIMIGEVNDTETAEAVVHAALLGHRLIAAVNAEDSFGAIASLLKMKIEPHLLASTLNMVIAQRLCRRICSKCKTENEFNNHEMLNGWDIYSNMIGYRGDGCSACNHTGYLGKTVVCEALPINSKIKSFIINGLNEKEQQLELPEIGRPALAQNAFEKVKQGIISWEEALNVV